MNKALQIAIDFRWLDHLSPGSGQFRYAVDLINGLVEAQSPYRFLFLGSKPEPIAEVAQVFAQSYDWKYEAIPRLNGRGWLYREQAQYLRMLRKLNINLLHALHTFVPIYPPVPVVETVYDLMYELFPDYSAAVQSREYRMHKWAFERFVTRAIAISKTTALDLSRLWHYPANQIDVVYLGPKLPAIDRVQRQEPPVILSPYNLEPRKNLSLLLRAAAILKASGLEFRLVLFGRAAIDEARERAFRQELSQLGLESRTELTGRVSDEELVRWYASSSVFVFPSLYEGFGLPVLEAMSAGARVVAHHASAMAEIVGDAGYLVDMTNTLAITDAIQKAMSDSFIGAEAAQRSREFNRDRMVRETLAVYAKALSL